MKLGLLTAAFPALRLVQVADWAAANEFDALEVACWPAGEGAARRYAGVCHIDVDDLDDAAAGRIAESLQRRGLTISALAYYPNNLDPDDDAPAGAPRRGLGVQVAIENCPMIFSYDECHRGGHQPRLQPAHVAGSFEAIPDAHFGLNLDPSHLVWQMIDAERVVYEFADRILHAHGKDLEVRRDGLHEHGVMSTGIG